jgi:hypothetical protein
MKNGTNRETGVAPIAILVASLATTPLAFAQGDAGARLIRSAADALGGQARVEAAGTLVIEGQGSSWAPVGGVSPQAEQDLTKVTDLRQRIDLAHGRMRVTATRTLQFPFALATVQKQDQGIDGDLAYNIGGFGGGTTPIRLDVEATHQRRIEMLSHPLTLVRAALDPKSRLGAVRQEGANRTVEITTGTGETVTLAVDKSGLPVSVAWTRTDDNLGDILTRTSFSQYVESAGLKLPARITTQTDRWKTGDLTVSYAVNSDVGDLAAPEAVRSANPPQRRPAMVTAEPIGKGVWYMGGTGEHSVLFEFADHLVLFETPGDDDRTLAVIRKARETVPGKPLTFAINSHHHFDHAGGFRAAVSEGLTMYAYRDNQALFREVAARKHTLRPDALAKNPKPLKFQAVDDMLTMKDSAQEIVIYHVRPDPHGPTHCATELMVWVPRDRLLLEADQYDHGWLQHPWGENFIANVERIRHLNVDKVVPVHGMGPEPWSEVVATIHSKPPAAAGQ